MSVYQSTAATAIGLIVVKGYFSFKLNFFYVLVSLFSKWNIKSIVVRRKGTRIQIAKYIINFKNNKKYKINNNIN